MVELSIDELKSIPKKRLRNMLNKALSKIKGDETVLDMFKEYGVDIEEIDLVPIAFAEMDVSARTDHGIIYLNYRLINDGKFSDDVHYLVHELTHFLQQTTGTEPTEGSTEDTYLDNKDEQEGFQNQTEFISREDGEDAAEDYVEQVLDHHEVTDNKERKKRKDSLLSIAHDVKY